MKSLKQLLASTISLLGLITSANASFNADEWESVDYGYDNNGNVTELYDGDTGEIVGRYEYDPYGNTTKIEGKAAQENKIRFSTKEYDETSGLYYYGYRHYDPKSGRWPSRDPIEEDGGQNLYAFVENDGINHLDFLGLVNCKVGDTSNGAVTARLGSWTRSGKLGDDVVSDTKDVLDAIDDFKTFQSLLAVATTGLNFDAMANLAAEHGLTSSVKDAGDVALIIRGLTSIADAIGENPSKGALIEITFTCKRCLCDEDTGTNYWESDEPSTESFGIVHPDEADADKGKPVYNKDSLALRKKVSEITAQDITNAITKAVICVKFRL